MANTSLDEPGPPWYVKDEHGRIDALAIPERLRTHPEIQRRGIVLSDPLKPGSVYSTSTLHDPQYAVKILRIETEERKIYEMLLVDIRNPHNHTLPAELTETGYPLLIMPRLWTFRNLHRGSEWSLHEALGYLLQVVEGVEYLHRRHIAHLDLCVGNILVSGPEDEPYHERIVAYKIFIIDFDSAQRFKLGPGVQPAIQLPPSQTRPPEWPKALRSLLLGRLLYWARIEGYIIGERMQSSVARDIRVYITKLNYEDEEIPRLASWYVQWLIGSERGCTTACRCRPTARRARQILVLIRSILYLSEICGTLFERFSSLFNARSYSD
ncbi:hypothetical protein ONZ51_g7977 [Trametes cubensis]|uniref:Protein kinase domain-containing protein n=1 Tax=Trametes cubensis TaxID=1111947 RepID=A0AAD7X8N5_9APHY|nr:hypothetical protein ONZ51_g7977 [Trametes cubensis]